MTTLDHAHHIIRRRGYAPHYTPTNVAKLQPEMHESMCEVLNVCHLLQGNESRVV
jgi:cytochrome P450